VNVQRAERPNDLARKREREKKPKKDYEAIDDRQANQDFLQV